MSQDRAIGVQGNRGDTAATTDTGTFSRQSLFKRLLQKFTTQFPAALTALGNLKVAIQEALPAGTNAIGTVDTELTTQDFDTGAGTVPAAVVGLVVPAAGGPVAVPGDAANGLDVDVTRLPALVAGAALVGAVAPGASATVGTGLLTFRDAALSNVAVAVKASAGKVHGHNLFNPGVALAYVHYYDAAQVSVTVGTTIPKLSIALPSNATAQIGTELFSEVGLAFGTAITIAASTTPGGATAPATALVSNVYYI